MNKECLEALERLYCSGNLQLDYVLSNKHKQDYDIIATFLIKAEEQEKALKTIFEKKVSIFQLICCKNFLEYNDLKFLYKEKLTQEEFDLLKEMLENDSTRTRSDKSV